ncbi:hypothetical protein INR49_024439 [Caranx melampygus]|nr:hypothetical protein INR49_024439 [Caranx melampygus]
MTNTFLCVCVCLPFNAQPSTANYSSPLRGRPNFHLSRDMVTLLGYTLHVRLRSTNQKKLSSRELPVSESHPLDSPHEHQVKGQNGCQSNKSGKTAKSKW